MDFELPEDKLKLVKVEQLDNGPVLHFSTTEGGPRTLTFRTYSYGSQGTVRTTWEEKWHLPTLFPEWGQLLGQVSAHRCNPRQLHLKGFASEPKPDQHLRGIYCRNCGLSWAIDLELLTEQAEQFTYMKQLNRLAKRLGWVDLAMLGEISEFDPVDLGGLTPEQYQEVTQIAFPKSVKRRAKKRVQLVTPLAEEFTPTATYEEKAASLEKVNAKLRDDLAKLRKRYTERQVQTVPATPITASRNNDEPLTEAEQQYVDTNPLPPGEPS